MKEVTESVVNKVATIFDVANYFRWRVDYEAGDNITPLKLQKLCYYAQAYHLAFTGEPLFEEEFEAWDHGPANYALWHEYKEKKWNPIPPDDALWNTFFPAEVFECDELDTLNEVWDAFGDYGAKYLENLTHQEDPWKNAGRNTVIEKSVMQAYYSRRLEEYSAEN